MEIGQLIKVYILARMIIKYIFTPNYSRRYTKECSLSLYSFLSFQNSQKHVSNFDKDTKIPEDILSGFSTLAKNEGSLLRTK